MKSGTRSHRSKPNGTELSSAGHPCLPVTRGVRRPVFAGLARETPRPRTQPLARDI